MAAVVQLHEVLPGPVHLEGAVERGDEAYEGVHLYHDGVHVLQQLQRAPLAEDVAPGPEPVAQGPLPAGLQDRAHWLPLPPADDLPLLQHDDVPLDQQHLPAYLLEQLRGGL